MYTYIYYNKIIQKKVSLRHREFAFLAETFSAITATNANSKSRGDIFLEKVTKIAHFWNIRNEKHQKKRWLLFMCQKKSPLFTITVL